MCCGVEENKMQVRISAVVVLKKMTANQGLPFLDSQPRHLKEEGRLGGDLASGWELVPELGSKVEKIKYQQFEQWEEDEEKRKRMKDTG